MKTNLPLFTVIVYLLSSVGCNVAAQLGINTEKPLSLMHIDAAANNGTNTVDPALFSDDVIFTDEGKLAAGKTTAIANLDIRATSGNSAIGIGNTSQTAAQAGAGAVRFNTSTKCLEYSNGTVWSCMPSVARKLQVLSQKNVAQNISVSTLTTVSNWATIKDNTEGAYNAATGIFTAPRTGRYAVSFIYSFNSGAINANTQIEAQIEYNSLFLKYLKAFPSAITSTSTAYISGIVSLNAGQQLSPRIWQTTGSTKTISTSGNTRFSLVEL